MIHDDQYCLWDGVSTVGMVPSPAGGANSVKWLGWELRRHSTSSFRDCIGYNEGVVEIIQRMVFVTWTSIDRSIEQFTVSVW